jgi:hypothetical protein
MPSGNPVSCYELEVLRLFVDCQFVNSNKVYRQNADFRAVECKIVEKLIYRHFIT